VTSDQPKTVTLTKPTEREIHVERAFDAPRERVFAAFTDPELIPQWWGRGHVETATFDDLGDRTKFTTTLLFDTTEERDNLLKYGGEAGMNESYARLDALLARLVAR
jgi:uncharacterized protein YndB with AHSA1/START domain